MSISQKRPSLKKRQTSGPQLPVYDHKIKYLGLDHIKLYNSCESESNTRWLVPPSSPREIFIEHTINSIPESFSKVKNCCLPKVRRIGVKASIEALAEIFQCNEFKTNLLQFWFLDMIADCLWRAQDEYHFSDAQQSVILEWILYFFKLIKAPNMNLSRKQVFRIFREAITLAETYVEAGAEVVPDPEQLFTLKTEALEDLGSDLKSQTSQEIIKEQDDFLIICQKSETEIFKLPKKGFVWDIDEECDSSSVESVSDNCDRHNEENEPEITDKSSVSTESESNFYKPDMSTPPRFKPSITELQESEFTETLEIEQSSAESSGDAVWRLSPRKHLRGPCPSRVFQAESENDFIKPTQKELEEAALQAWYEYHLWQLRKNYTEIETFVVQENEWEIQAEAEKVQNDFIQYFKKELKNRKKINENRFINIGVLMAIKEFILDYFYESLQFDLIRIAYRTQHNFLTQELIKDWNIPKSFKGILKRPLPKKKKVERTKPEKIKKESKEKKSPKKGKEKGKKKHKEEVSTEKEAKIKKSPKKSKGSKSAKTSEKTDETDDKSEKKKKKAKAAKGKTDSEPDSEKAETLKQGKTPKKKTKDKKSTGKTSKSPGNIPGVDGAKERLRETEKQIRDKRSQEAEEKQTEENRKFIFPLSNAVDDHFFKRIFKNWTKPESKSKSSHAIAILATDTKAPHSEKKNAKEKDSKPKKGKKGKILK